MKGLNKLGNLSKPMTIMSIALVVCIWGVMWPVNKIALQYTPPILFAGMRAFIGGLFMFVVFFTKATFDSLERKLVAV